MRSSSSAREKPARNISARLQDVAARAGVSTATVSRVINGSAIVSPQIRARVEAARVALNYLPEVEAPPPASRASGTIGAVMPTVENDAFARTVFVLQKMLAEAGMTLLLVNTDYDPEAELRAVTRLLAQGVEGLMLIGGEHHPALRAKLERKRIPVVEAWSLNAAGASIGFDNIRAAEELTDHLLDLGHRHIAVVAGTVEYNDRMAARLTGVRRSLARRELYTHSEWLTDQPYRIGEGRLAMQRILAAPGIHPTAIICGNDALAFGVLVEARAHLIPVPRQLSVVGFGDSDYAEFLDPPLTTMRVPAEEIGALAANYLLRRLAGESVAQHSRVEVRLVARGSTAAAPRVGYLV